MTQHRERPIQFNVLNQPLESCGTQPKTGFFRDGSCRTDDQDLGSHTVCAIMTDAFLEYSLNHGNDLSTPRPEYDFPGLVAGNRWCVCALRWREAFHAGVAPGVVLSATHRKTLEIIPLDELLIHAVDTPRNG